MGGGITAVPPPAASDSNTTGHSGTKASILSPPPFPSMDEEEGEEEEEFHSLMDLSLEATPPQPSPTPIFSSPMDPHDQPPFLPEGQMNSSELIPDDSAQIHRYPTRSQRLTGARSKEQAEGERTIELTPLPSSGDQTPVRERALPPRPRGRPRGCKKRKEASPLFSPFKRVLWDRGARFRSSTQPTSVLPVEGANLDTSRSPRPRLRSLSARVWPYPK